MTPPTPAELEWARRALAYEIAALSPGPGTATPPSLVYDKLMTHVAPLLGNAGVQTLLARSARLAGGEFAVLAGMPASIAGTRIREMIGSTQPPFPLKAAESLFATFFALLTTFIGERLTTQVLRRAWPTIDAPEPGDSTT